MIKDLVKDTETEGSKIQQENIRNSQIYNKGFDLFQKDTGKRTRSPTKFQPRMLIEMVSQIKINRVINNERLGTMIKKYDDERNMMKNNIEQNNKMTETFVEKDNMIKKIDIELNRL